MKTTAIHAKTNKLPSLLLALVLTMALVLSFAGCNKDEAETDSAAASSTVTSVVSSEQSTTKKATKKTTVTKEDVKDVTEGEALTYGDNKKTEAPKTTARATTRTTAAPTTRRTTAAPTTRTTVRTTVRTTTASSNDAGCIGDDAETY